ncbi:MAG: CDP-glycerol glycerophosphotransferase family protein [Clostridia bacterium]|nr:CDP-glycerol glycerophosphotransferase family protein [Clostridia bacterium]
MKNCFKYFIALLLRALLSPLTLLPVKRDRVMFVAYRGTRYSCSPRAVSEQLEKLAGGRLEINWGLRHPENYAFLRQQGVNVINDRGLKFIYRALTSRVVVTNIHYKPYLPRRKGQFFIHTWHGGGLYKREGMQTGMTRRYLDLQGIRFGAYLSSSREFTKRVIRGSFGWKGEVLEWGLPRNDVFFSPEKESLRRNIRARLGWTGKHIALYAPTWRDDQSDFTPFDADAVRRALARRFGGSWEIWFRGHYYSDTAALSLDGDVSSEEDMQPLLLAADCLITDYSSSIWDASLGGLRTFLYCPDVNNYVSIRNFYSDIHTWPGVFAEDSQSLINAILSFDEAAYAEKIARHHRDLGSCETGRAAILTAERILKECGK